MRATEENVAGEGGAVVRAPPDARAIKSLVETAVRRKKCGDGVGAGEAAEAALAALEESGDEAGLQPTRATALWVAATSIAGNDRASVSRRLEMERQEIDILVRLIDQRPALETALASAYRRLALDLVRSQQPAAAHRALLSSAAILERLSKADPGAGTLFLIVQKDFINMTAPYLARADRLALYEGAVGAALDVSRLHRSSAEITSAAANLLRLIYREMSAARLSLSAKQLRREIRLLRHRQLLIGARNLLHMRARDA